MNNLIKKITLFLTLFAMSFLPASLYGNTADKVLKNGVVWTVCEEQPVAEALAIRDGKIIAVTSNDQIKAYMGDETKVIDVGGRLVLPGFIDNHTHFTRGGFQLGGLDLRFAENHEAFSRLIGEWAKKHPGEWITRGNWDHDYFSEGTLPYKELIDPLTPDTPVFVTRYDGHMGLANSYALELAGVTSETPSPPGGEIVKDPETGEPTGILRNAAMRMVTRHIPEPTVDDIVYATRHALEKAARLGVTGIHDMSSPDDLRAYQYLHQNEELTTRVYAILPFSLWPRLADVGIQAPFGDDFIQLGGLKAMADGSLGSSTALFMEPYTSDSGTYGLASDVLSDGRLEEWVMGADKAGLQPVIHAIGDQGNREVLKLYEKAIRENPERERRFRIEHAQHIHPDDFQRFAASGVIAAVHPYHAIDDGRWAEGRIGKERCETSYAFRSFLDHGVYMSFGSDWTVAPLNPLLTIYAAVTRRTLDDKHPEGWFPEQKISVEEAIRAHTLVSAYSAFQENVTGSLTPGKFADLVILSDNILEIDPEKIKEASVMMTVVNGNIIYSTLD